MISISDVLRNKRVLETKWVLRAADGRFKANLVSLGWKHRHDTDCRIVAAKDKKISRSRNSVLDQGELSTQHYFGKQYTSSWDEVPTVTSEVSKSEITRQEIYDVDTVPVIIQKRK